MRMMKTRANSTMVAPDARFNRRSRLGVCLDRKLSVRFANIDFASVEFYCTRIVAVFETVMEVGTPGALNNELNFPELVTATIATQCPPGTHAAMVAASAGLVESLQPAALV